MSKKTSTNTFGMPGFGLPNPFDVSAFTGGVDVMKSLWGGASGAALPSIAGFIAPTLDLEELDRKIADLKSVEGWLASNAAMLRATVQALEVQRNTIVMLKSFASAPPGSESPPASWASTFKPAAPTSVETPEARRAASGLPPGWPTSPAAPSAPPPENPKPARAAPKAPAPAAPPENNGIANTAAWWNMLQDQFTKVASAAVAASGGAPPRAQAPAAKSAARGGMPHAKRSAPADRTAAVGKPAGAPTGHKTARKTARKTGG